MNEAENINRIVAALLTVPEKKLLLIQLVNSIPIKNGEMDYQVIQSKQLEINLAITEAKSYGAHTMMAVDALRRLRSKGDAVV
jgi:hypothetical protein